jgi:hypothetical protein
VANFDRVVVDVLVVEKNRTLSLLGARVLPHVLGLAPLASPTTVLEHAGRLLLRDAAAAARVANFVPALGQFMAGDTYNGAEKCFAYWTILC